MGTVNVGVRELGRGDLEAAGHVLFSAFRAAESRHGYAPRMRSAAAATAWAATILRHGEGDFLVATVDGRVGGICCLNRRGRRGGIGPVAVDPSLRGQGIGRALMGAVLERADGLESVRLYQEAFNAASFTLYYSLDFLPAAVLLDLFRPSRNTCGDQSQPGVRCATIADLDSLLRYDTPRSNYDRRVDLTFYLRWGQVLVLEHGAVIDGYLACLPTAESVQFGPLVAHSEAAAQCLFQHAIPLYPDRIQQTRIMARDQRLAAALRRAGFRLYCVDLLMVRGAWRPGRCVEAFGRFPEGI